MKSLTVSVAVLVVAVLSVWGQNQSAAASSSPSGRTAKLVAEGYGGDVRANSSSAVLSRIFARVLPGYTFKRSKMKGCRVDRVSPDGFWTYRAEDSKTNEVAWSDFYKRYPANFNETIDWFSSNEGTNVFGTCRSRVVFMRHAANVIDEYCSEISGAKERCAKLRSQADELTQTLRKSATVGSARQTSEIRQARKSNNGKGTETIEGITWQYELVDDVAVVGSVNEITRHAVANNAIGGNVRIPAQLGGCEVGCIGPLAFAGCGRIFTIDIPDSVTNIGEHAFWGCENLQKMVIPPHVTQFGNGVLAQCKALRSLRIPAGVTNFAEEHLSFPNLREIHLDARNPVLKMNNGILWNSRTGELILCLKDTKGDLILPQGIKRIKRWQFKDCKGLTSVEIPEGVTEIGEYAFWCCEGMKTVKLPKSLRSIAEGAFYHCVNLESIEIPDGITEIPYRAFEDCRHLKTVTIPASVDKIGDRVFDGCSDLENVIRLEKKGLTRRNSKLPVALLPKDGRIAEFDFEGCASNRVDTSATVSGVNMEVKDGVLSFDGQYRGGHWDVVFPELDFDGFTLAMSFSPNDIGKNHVLIESLGLIHAYFGTGNELGFTSYGRHGCRLRSGVWISTNTWNWFVISVDAIGKSIEAVVNGQLCRTSLSDRFAWQVAQSTPNDIARSIEFGSPGYGSRFNGKVDDIIMFGRPLSTDEMQRIANGQPPLQSAKTVAKPDDAKVADSDPPNRSDAWTLRWARKNRSCFWNASISKDGVVVEAHCDGHEICLQPLSYVAEKLDLSAPVVSPDGEKYVITGIGAKENFLQGYCSSHKTVLREVILPETVTNLYAEAFKGSMLQEILLPTNLVQIGKEAFRECHGLTSITIPSKVTRVGWEAFNYCDNLKTVVLSEGVQDVDGLAYSHCRALTEIVIPASVKEIGDRAFQECKSLVSVDIRGTDVKVAKLAFHGDTPVGAKMPDLSKPVGPISVVAERKASTGRIKGEWTEPQTGIVWHYEADDGVATILRMDTPGWFDGHVSIPEYIDGNFVTHIKGLSPNVVSLSVPEGVGCFGGTSVPWLPRLEALSLPASWRDGKSFNILQPSLKTVTINPSNEYFTVSGGLVCDKEMKRVVFCPGGAEEIVLPEYVEDVTKLFRYTGKLRSIRVAPGNSRFEARDGVLYDKGMTTLVRCPNVREKIVIPSSVKVIGAQAFCGCKTLTEVRIPDTVTEVGAAAFSSCTGLCSVVLSKNLTCISRCMFSDCTSLKSITLPQSVRKIDWGAFIDCCSLQSVLVDAPEGIECADGQTLRVEDVAFLRCGNLTSIDLPGLDVRLFSKPFGGCTNLTELSFLPRMQVLWTDALEDTAYYRAMSNGTPIVFHSRLMGIKEPSPVVLEIPSGVVEIAETAFSGNKALKSVVIPTSVTNIERRAFSGCSQLETVTIPESVARIGYDSFSNCTNLKTVITATDDTNRVARIEQAFGREMKVSESGKLIVLPKQEEKTKPGGSAKKDRATSKRQTSSEYVWCDPKTGVTWCFSLCKDNTASLKPDRCFSKDMPTLSGDIVVPEMLDGHLVTDIIWWNMNKCVGLTSLRIPKTVRQLRMGSASVSSLTNLTIEAGCGCCRSVGRFVLEGTWLQAVCAGGTKRLVIPEEVEGLVEGCFAGASWLEEVRIPSTVKKVAASAFAGCKGLYRRFDPDGKGYMVFDGWLIPDGNIKCRDLEVPADVRHIASTEHPEGCWKSVASVKLPKGLVSIGKGAFVGSNIETIEFPASLRCCYGFGKAPVMFGRRVVSDRPLRNVIFNSGDVTFSLPDSVRRVTFAEGVTDIGVVPEGRSRSGLSGGAGVATVVLPAGLRSIHSLPDFPELTEITIPSSVTNIGKTVFMGCKKLESVGVEKSGAVELVPIDDFRKQWNLFFPDGNLHLTDTKTGIRWLCKRGGGLSFLSDAAQAINSIRIVGAEEGDASSALAIPETLAGLTVDGVDWDKLKFPSVVELRIPRSLKSFSCRSAGNAMPNLQSVVVVEGNESYCSSDGVLCDVNALSVVDCPCAREGRVTVSEGIKRIARGAFADCTNITEVILPSSVESIGAHAFSGCTRLEKIFFPEGLCEIGEGAFDGCVKLFEKLNRYDGFYVLDGWAVDPWGLGVLEHGVHGGKLVLPEGVRGVAAQTFMKRQSPKFATNETWTANVIASVSLPKSLRHIGEYAFCGIDVASIELPDGVCSVGEQAFTGCTNLLSVSVPATIESWDKCARTFWGCSRLKIVRLSDGLCTLPWYGFCDCRGIDSVSIPASVTNGLTAAFLGCSSLLSLEVSPGNQAYKSIDGVVYTKDGKKLLCCPQSKKTVDIPDGVEEIGSFAFNGCSLVKAVDLPPTVTNIGSWAFAGCSSLRSLNIPEGVKNIGDYAFGNNRRLMTLRLPSTLRSIGRLASRNDCVPECILTASGDADRILKLVRSCDREIFLRDRCFMSSVRCGPEDRFVVEGNALVRLTSGFARWRDPETGIAWLYSVQDDKAVDVRTEFLEGYKGHLEVPALLGGKQVSGLLGLDGGGDITSLSLPMGVTNIDPKALGSCTKLKSVNMNVDGELKTIGMEDLRKQWNLSVPRKPSFRPASGNLRQGGSLRARRLQRQQQEAAAKVQNDEEKAEREKQIKQLQWINEELRRVREAKAAEKQKGK